MVAREETRRPSWARRAAIGVLAAGFLAFFSIDEITRRVIEDGTEDALGIDVSLSLVRLGVFGGGVQLYGLSVPNPEGFEGDDLISIEHASVGLRLHDLLADRVVVPRLEVDGVRVDLERRGVHTNYGPMLKRLERSKGQPQDSPEHADSAFDIKEIRITEVEAHVRMLPELGAVPDAQKLTGLENIQVKIPEIVLHDVTARGDLTELVARLTDLVTAAVLDSVARHATGLPSAMVSELASVSGSLGSSSLRIVGEVTQVGGTALDDTIEAALGETAGNAARAVTHGTEEAIGGVEGLLDRATN